MLLLSRKMLVQPDVSESSATTSLRFPSTLLSFPGFTRTSVPIKRQDPVISPSDTESKTVTVRTVVASAGGITLTALKNIQSCPKSALARARAVPMNAGRHCPQGGLVPSQDLIGMRLREHPASFEKRLVNGKRRLFCIFCQSPVSPKADHVRDHLLTKKHVQREVSQIKTAESDRKQRDYIRDYFDASNAKGANLDLETLKFRFKTLESFLDNGIPLMKIDGMRPLLENYGKLTLTASTHLREYLPALLREEVKKLVDECKEAEWICVIFDGTTRVDEVFAIVFRWVTQDMIIVQRVVEIGKYAHSFNHNEIVASIMLCLGRFHVDKSLHSNETGAQ
jgi:hypothetical protein